MQVLGSVLCDPPVPTVMKALTNLAIWARLVPAHLAETKAPPKNATIDRKQGELWTIHGQKYDLAAFVDRHPGGTEAILLGKGADGHDCTQLFESYHPFTERHRLVLAKYAYKGATTTKIQPLGESVFDEINTPFRDDALRAVRAYFSPNGTETDHEVQRNTKATTGAWVLHAFGMCLVSYYFYLWCRGDVPAILIFPALYWVVCSDLMHNGSHFAMSTIPWVNTVSTYIGCFHVQYHLWAVQHVIGHHTHTNVLHRDPDLAHFSHESEEEKYVPGYRSHRSQDVLPKYHLFWKFAVYFQAGATTVAIALLNVPMYLEKGKMMTTLIPEHYTQHIKIDRALLLLGCVVFCCFHGAWVGIWTMLWSWVVHGALFNFFSQISHINESSMVATEEYKERKKLEKNEWAVHQMLTANDYSCDSKFWGIMSINLNQQIMHHMFPSIHPCHYPALRHVLIPVAAKHGLDYKERSSNTFLQAAAQYLSWLYHMNETARNKAATFMSHSSIVLCIGASLGVVLFYYTVGSF